MCPSRGRRFGLHSALPIVLAILLLSFGAGDCSAQQDPGVNFMQTPQVVRFSAPMLLSAPPPVPRIDPATLLRFPVTVIDAHGHCIDSLNAKDFSLSINGRQDQIELFHRNRTTSAALAILVDVSDGMSFRSWHGGKSLHGGVISKVPLARDAVAAVLERIDAHDDMFLASFARRFHIIQDFSADRHGIEDRLAMLRPSDDPEDRNGDGIYEGMIKGITALAHASKSYDRRALMVFTSDLYDTSTHGIEDVIARAQFAGVTVYNIVVLGFEFDAEESLVRSNLGRIAAETGGHTFIVRWRDYGDILDAAAEITAELDSQYILGFAPVPSNDNVEGVDLTVNDPTLYAHAPKAVRYRPDKLPKKLSALGAMLPE